MPSRQQRQNSSNLHIYLHTFTEARNNLFCLLLFESTRNALKIRRPLPAEGVQVPLWAPVLRGPSTEFGISPTGSDARHTAQVRLWVPFNQ